MNVRNASKSSDYQPSLGVRISKCRRAKAAEGRTHSKTLRALGDCTDSRQRLECGGFSTAVVRTEDFIHPQPCHARESGGERAALQTPRDAREHFAAAPASFESRLLPLVSA